MLISNIDNRHYAMLSYKFSNQPHIIHINAVTYARTEQDTVGKIEEIINISLPCQIHKYSPKNLLSNCNAKKKKKA